MLLTVLELNPGSKFPGLRILPLILQILIGCWSRKSGELLNWQISNFWRHNIFQKVFVLNLGALPKVWF